MSVRFIVELEHEDVTTRVIEVEAPVSFPSMNTCGMVGQSPWADRLRRRSSRHNELGAWDGVVGKNAAPRSRTEVEANLMIRAGLRSFARVAPPLALLTLVATSHAVGAIVTNAADTYRTGWYPDQASLTPALVAGAGFAQRFSTPIVGKIFAQPLVANQDTLFVATEENWIYRIDPETGKIFWGRQVAVPWNPADLGCHDIIPWIGITGTPVIDEGTNTAYFVSKTYASGTSGPAAFWVYAVDLYTGASRPNFPVEISGTAQNSAQVFDATYQLQRPGLLLLDGVVYAAFGGICDTSPWQGWIVGVSTSGQIKAMWTSRATVGGDGAAIWQSGGGLVSDGPGRLFVATGNGGSPSTPIPGTTPPGDLGDSVVRLSVQTDGTLQAEDFFTPFNGDVLDDLDLDLGSGTPTAFPDAYFGTVDHPHLAIQVGKEGVVYLLDRDALGGCQQGPGGADNVVNRSGPYAATLSRPTIWPGDGGWVYFPMYTRGLQMFQYDLDGQGVPTLNLLGATADVFGYGTGSAVVTSNGLTSGSALVWVIYLPDANGLNAELRAYDPVPSGSTAVLRRSLPVGTGARFASPGIGLGRVYVGTADGHVLMYGPTVAHLTVDKVTATGSLHLQWSGGNAPFVLERAEDPAFTVNPTILLNQQSSTSFDDPALNDSTTYYYRVH